MRDIIVAAVSLIVERKIDIILAAVGVFIGASITWALADYYYEEASIELKAEAGKLRKLNNLMLRAMEKAKLATFSRDKNEQIIGFELQFNVSERVGAHDSLTGEVIKSTKNKDRIIDSSHSPIHVEDNTSTD